MSASCYRCVWLAEVTGQPPPHCRLCVRVARRELLAEVALSPDYRGVPLDRALAGIVAAIAGVVAAMADRGPVVAGAGLTVLVCAAVSLFSRRRSADLPRHGRRRVSRPRDNDVAETAAAAASPIATRRRPHSPGR